MCLETLLHHASIRNYAKDIAELNGLPLLTEIYHRFKDNIDVTATICRIISYLSMHSELLDDLFKSGKFSRQKCDWLLLSNHKSPPYG